MQMTGTRASNARVDALLRARKLRRDNPLQIGRNSYMILDALPVCINHSCAPNAGIRTTNTLVALRSIKKGEELTFDYSTVVGEVNEGWYMSCACGAPSCRKTIGAWTTLPPKRIRYYKQNNALPDFVLKEVLKKN